MWKAYLHWQLLWLLMLYFLHLIWLACLSLGWTRSCSAEYSNKILWRWVLFVTKTISVLELYLPRCLIKCAMLLYLHNVPCISMLLSAFDICLILETYYLGKVFWAAAPLFSILSFSCWVGMSPLSRFLEHRSLRGCWCSLVELAWALWVGFWSTDVWGAVDRCLVELAWVLRVGFWSADLWGAVVMDQLTSGSWVSTLTILLCPGFDHLVLDFVEEAQRRR